MPAPTVTAILKRWDDLKADRWQYSTLWQEIADYVFPSKSGINRERTPGARKTTEIYDSTAPHAAQLLAASIHGTLTPSTQAWLSLKLRDDELNETKEAQDWLEDTARRIHLAYRQSNFATSVHEVYLDLVGPSATGCLFAEEKDPPATGGFGGFRFRAHPAAEYCLAEDAEGRVDTIYRSFRVSARALVKKWGSKAGDRVIQRLETKPDDQFEVLHAVFPRDEYQQGRTGARNMPWASCYIVVESKHKIDEGGYHEFPFMVPRWSKSSGETYGFGPSHVAIPDVRSLNEAKRILLQAAPLAMFPPTVERDDSVIGEADLTPAGRNVVSGSGPLGELFAFMQTGMKVDLSQLVLADLRQGIRQIYFTDQLEMPERPNATATEIQIRYELMLRLLGSTHGRLEAELLNPLVERSFGLMARAGALLPVPDVLRERLGDADLDIEYEGPLARAQRTMELTAQDRVVNFVIAVAGAMIQAGVPPGVAAGVWDVLKIDYMVRERAQITGLSFDSLRGEDEVNAMRQVRAQEAEEAKELAQASQVAEAAGKAAPAFKELQAAAQNGGQTR